LTGLSHKSAPVEMRERLSVDPGVTPEWLQALRETAGTEECALLATCNRMEVYLVSAAGEETAAGQQRLLQFLAVQAGVAKCHLEPHLYCLDSIPAVRHLFRVAAGLDSMVMGESQILSQVKEALGFAQNAGTAGGVLQGLLRRAIETGKRVRSETEIARGAVSISWAAIQLAQQIFGRSGSSRGRTALIVGAGETGERTARLLLAEKITTNLLVCNRTWERAAELAGSLGGEAIPFERLSDALARADMVISSTGAQRPILTRAMLRQTVHARRGKPIFLIDIAVPRDVEPEAADLDDLFLYNIDDLQAVVEKSLALRQSEVERVDAIVEEEVHRFLVWLRTQEVGPTISALQRHAEMISAREMDQLRARLAHLSTDEFQHVEAAVRSVVKKLLHQPMVHLRSAAASGNGYHEVESVRAMFGLDGGSPPPEEGRKGGQRRKNDHAR